MLQIHPSRCNEGLITAAVSHMQNDHHSLTVLFCFWLIFHNRSNCFLLIDTACVWSSSSLHVFPSHVTHRVLCFRPARPLNLHVCLCLLLSGVWSLCSVFVLLCMCLWEMVLKELGLLYNASHMWAYCAPIQLICRLDQLFTDCKCTYVSSSYVTGMLLLVG